jgi:hypothetical protein
MFSMLDQNEVSSKSEDLSTSTQQVTAIIPITKWGLDPLFNVSSWHQFL